MPLVVCRHLLPLNVWAINTSIWNISHKACWNTLNHSQLWLVISKNFFFSVYLNSYTYFFKYVWVLYVLLPAFVQYFFATFLFITSFLSFLIIFMHVLHNIIWRSLFFTREQVSRNLVQKIYKQLYKSLVSYYWFLLRFTCE